MIRPALSLALAGAVYLLLAVDALIWVYLCYRFATFPENHWSMDNRQLIPFFVVQQVASMAIVFLGGVPKPLSIAFAVVSAISVAASVLLITENVLLPYDLWVKRGMPQRPF